MFSLNFITFNYFGLLEIRVPHQGQRARSVVGFCI
jgi:hypothetical protein